MTIDGVPLDILANKEHFHAHSTQQMFQWINQLLEHIWKNRNMEWI
jgi:hypothetical protein